MKEKILECIIYGRIDMLGALLDELIKEQEKNKNRKARVRFTTLCKLLNVFDTQELTIDGCKYITFHQIIQVKEYKVLIVALLVENGGQCHTIVIEAGLYTAIQKLRLMRHMNIEIQRICIISFQEGEIRGFYIGKDDFEQLRAFEMGC